MLDLNSLAPAVCVVIIGLFIKPLSRGGEAKVLPSDFAIGPQLTLAASIQLANYWSRHHGVATGYDASGIYLATAEALALLVITTFINRLADEDKNANKEAESPTFKQYALCGLSFALGFLALILSLSVG